jgi:hypothetical protein
MNGVDLQNFFDFSIGFAIVLATMGAMTAGLFIFFKKKQWILAGTDPLDTGININSSKAGTSGSSESLDDHTWNKKQEEYNNNIDHSNPRDKVAKSSADKISGSET